MLLWFVNTSTKMSSESETDIKLDATHLPIIHVLQHCTCLIPFWVSVYSRSSSLSVGHYELCRDDIGGFTWKPRTSLTKRKRQ